MARSRTGVLISEGFKELGEFFQKIPAEKRVKRHMSESLEKRQANSRLAEVVFSAVMKMFLRSLPPPPQSHETRFFA